MKAPRPAPPSLATSVRAEASSGPEQGLHTRPSSPPSASAPSSEPALSRLLAACALLAIGITACVKRSLSTGTSITRPKAISRAAPTVRTLSASTPSAGPSAPSSRPMPANEAVMPAPMASGASGLDCTAPPSTRGSSGNTQGESVVRLPATMLRPRWESVRSAIAAPFQRADFSASRSAAASVSPPERRVSWLPR